MYMIREKYQAQRGRAPELVAGFNILDRWFEQAGYTNRRIYVDYDGPMDTVVYQFELASLDQYFSDERALFVDPDQDSKALIDLFNNTGQSGHREIYEVIQ